ncbi:MAG: Na/Pi cotransporter family protein [Lachnospiraceae bacterium]|nr:Na/Pi cotransporter family protein [Lachnospiraceae bacterium]
MGIFEVLTMIGGLALFLFGMNALSEGLEKLSGGRLEKILQNLTSSPIKAVLLGILVTSVIQSSSATTVMVVGFVNSGIMRLTQAVGIIMGANIGTTTTAWILSLSGLEGSNLIMKLLKPTSFSPVLAAIGIIFIMFSKKQKKKDIGTLLCGFAILMFGMDMMSDAVSVLKDVPEFGQILLMFSNPILGMLAGAVITAVIQSSSASVGILQSLASTGAVPYATAFPIIMGQNIGTCITAILSAIGANKNAKRAACVHLSFNLLGTIIFMIGFYALDAIFNFAIMDAPIDEAGIAVIHSIFNIGATLLLLPFSKLLVKLATLIIKDGPEDELDEEEKDFQVLDPRFLDTPAIAMEQCRNCTVKMAEVTKNALRLAIGLLSEYDEKKAQKVVKLEKLTDRYEDELGTYMVKLSRRSLTEEDSHALSLLLHTIGDFERIGDHAEEIATAATEMNEKKLRFSEKAQKELKVLCAAAYDTVDMAFTSFANRDLDMAQRVEPLEEVVDVLNDELKRRHVQRLTAGTCTIELGFMLSDITTSLERIADHCSNVAVGLIQVAVDSYETHEYLGEFKANAEFGKLYKEYTKQYILPATGPVTTPELQ